MELDKRNLFNMPWSTNDSPLGWVEVTDVCNIKCRGCYRRNRSGHKPIDQLRNEVLFLKKWRNSDSIAIAGGEPTLHPDIYELIRFIRENRMKSLIITNGYGLTKERLTELRSAGLTGLSFNINASQERPDLRDLDEVNNTTINDIRLKYARMVADAGGLTAGFKITVDNQTINDVPDFVQWAVDNPGLINSITLVTFRGLPVSPEFEYFVNGEKISISTESLGYAISVREKEKISVTSNDIYKVIRKHFPEYDASSYLGGTAGHTSFKWLLGNIIMNSRGKMFGSYGKKTMEIIQALYHFIYGSYLLHLKKRKSVRKIFFLAMFDKNLRRSFRKFLKYILVNPLRLFYRINILNIAVLQAPDVLPDGTCDMCESCPDLCVYDGKLVPSCRLDEYIQYGGLLRIQRKD